MNQQSNQCTETHETARLPIQTSLLTSLKPSSIHHETCFLLSPTSSKIQLYNTSGGHHEASSARKTHRYFHRSIPNKNRFAKPFERLKPSNTQSHEHNIETNPLRETPPFALQTLATNQHPAIASCLLRTQTLTYTYICTTLRAGKPPLPPSHQDTSYTISSRSLQAIKPLEPSLHLPDDAPRSPTTPAS